jgi:tRNA modification GTPase
VIEEVVNIHGLPVRMLDTAGICEATDLIEQEGVVLALEKISQADLVLFMVDASRSLDNDDRFIANQVANKNFLLVMNKCDQRAIIEIPESLATHNPIRISTLSGDGIGSLHQAIYDSFLHGRAIDTREYVALSNARHRDALDKCLAYLRRFMSNANAGLNLELLAVDLRDALHAVGEVTGETTTDDVLDIIFQRFCIGK